jgi:hypothetical protein
MRRLSYSKHGPEEMDEFKVTSWVDGMHPVITAASNPSTPIRINNGFMAIFPLP